MSLRVLLGPQTDTARLKQTVDALDIDGPIVSITAGWRDSEGEVDELQTAMGREISDLLIYHRAEKVFASETALNALQRERQDKLLELQRLYRMRLTPTLQAARQLMRAEGEPDLLKLEQRAAISQVRALDRHHVRRIAAIHKEFDQRRTTLDIPAATEQREKVQQMMESAGLILIAGGHVAVLINRIRLFRLEGLLATRPLVAWSAGAMVLAERIVLFHDNAPQGRRDPEVLDAGLGITRGILPLPHAKSRLDWSSRTRMSVFSRRFAPAACVTLDEDSVLRLDNDRITEARGCSVVTRNGRRRVMDKS